MAPETSSLRVVYMGTPDFAVPALEALIESPHQVVGVVTNPDRKSGRGKRITASPVKVAAQRADIEVYQPRGLRNDEAFEQLSRWQPDVIVVAAYGRILPPNILELPKYGCINIHASLLPKYRGAAPINWCIVRGESHTGITIMQMNVGLDTGDMLLQRSIAIEPDETAQELHDRLAPLGAEMIVDALNLLVQGELKATAQDDAKSSYAPMLTKEDGRIDWTLSAHEVANHIRGFNPWPGAFAEHQGHNSPERIKFHRARALSSFEHDAAPGTVLQANAASSELVVACGQGAIACVEMQAPGKKSMVVRDFLNGYPLQTGDHFLGK